MGICGVKKRAVFLDRDGVLNDVVLREGKPYPPASFAELTIADDVVSSLQELKALNFLLIAATNQPDVARGTTSRSRVDEIHAKLMQLLPLDDIRVCFHDDSDGCLCRKPLPGLLTMAAEDYQIDLANSFMIGDRWRDVEAGQQAGCKTIWLRNEYNERGPHVPPDFTTTTLSQAVQWIKKYKE